MGPTLNAADGRRIRYLEKQQVERFLAVIDDNRDMVLFTLTYALGLRVSEVIGLRMGDVDLSAGRVLVRGRKRGWAHTHHLRPDVLSLVRAYVKDARAKAGDDERLFVSREAGSLSRQRVDQLFKSYTKAAEIRLLPGQGVHSLRHSAAVHALDAGAEAVDVQDLLRHRSMASTLVYARISNARRTRYEKLLEQSDAVARPPKRLPKKRTKGRAGR